jgi:hypothetical protein
MELFSKRNNNSSFHRRFVFEKGQEDERNKFLSEELRTRLCSQIEYISSSDNYIERFLLINNKNAEKFHFNYKELECLGKRELGYDTSSLFNQNPDTIDYGKSNDSYSDEKLLDLVELLIIFSKKEIRDNIISDFKNIFKEEDDSFVFHDFMIFRKSGGNIRSITPLIKDLTLKNKLEEYIKNNGNGNYEVLASISANILQNIFSSPNGQKDNKKYSEDLCERIAKIWTTKERVSDFKNLLDEEVKLLKNFNNQISNIRHSDKNVIPVGTPDFYKIIAIKNMAMVELVVLSLPQEYILEQDPEKLKNSYLSKYKVNKDAEWSIEPIFKDSDIKVENIPF